MEHDPREHAMEKYFFVLVMMFILVLIGIGFFGSILFLILKNFF